MAYLRISMETIISAITAAFPDERLDRLTPEMRFGEIRGWDSMNAVNFQAELESRLKGEILSFVVTDDMTLGELATRLLEAED